MSKRTAAKQRKTKETQVSVKLTLDGSGRTSVDTGIGFFDHMLELLTAHALFDAAIKASGDTRVDLHHTVEDVGIVLGEVLLSAVGGKKGIRRYGSASVPMDESLAEVTLDLSGRPYLVFDVEEKRGKARPFDMHLVEEFLRAVCSKAGITMHVALKRGRNFHHKCEAIFKAVGQALGAAVAFDPRVKGVRSTKGTL